MLSPVGDPHADPPAARRPADTGPRRRGRRRRLDARSPSASARSPLARRPGPQQRRDRRASSTCRCRPSRRTCRGCSTSSTSPTGCRSRSASTTPGWSERPSDVVRRARRGPARPGPSYVGRASASATGGSCHGGMWVSTSRPTSAAWRASPQSAPVRWRLGRVVVAVAERRLGEQQVGVRRPASTSPGTARCRRSRRAMRPSALDPQAVGRRPGARPGTASTVNGPTCDRLAVVARGSRTPRSCPGRSAGRRRGPSARRCRPGPRPGSAAAAPSGWYLRIT